MGSVDYIISRAEQHCSEQGLRLTDKRKLVLSGLLQSEKALSAYELVDICKLEFGQALPAMSVYRILDFLIAENFVHKLELANKYIACEHIGCDHPHKTPQFLICRRCNKVKEISVAKAAIEHLRASMQEAGFKQVGDQLEMSCLCASCISETVHN